MTLLVTFPGRAGDLFWALPTIRAISRRLGQSVALQIAGEFTALVPLLELQPYLGRVYADPAWSMSAEQHLPPPTRLEGYDLQVNLGYRGWPEPDVVQHTLDSLNHANRVVDPPLFWPPFHAQELALDEPWITLPPLRSVPTGQNLQAPAGIVAPRDLAIAFTDCHFELKVGLSLLILERFSRTRPDLCYRFLYTTGSRWDTEMWKLGLATGADWLGFASVIDLANVILADCSGAHALAVAMGKPVVLMEPMEARWNPIFYPLGKTGRVTLVTGNDGLPTYDARHVGDVLEKVL